VDVVAVIQEIKDVGAYAGFAAVVGLAVLSALYFSQARDLRRLREWAGRAPERAAEQVGVATPEQAAQQAARPAAGAVKAIPAVKPAGAKPETAAKPAPGKPGAPAPAATPAGKPAPGAGPPVPATAAAAAGAAGAAATASGPAPATPAAAPGKDKPDGDKPDTDKKDEVKAPDGAPPTPAPTPTGPQPATPSARPPTPPPVVPARPAPPVRSPAAAASASQSTAVLPASSARFRDRARGRGSGGDGLSARYIALIAAGVIVIGGGVVFGISQLGGDDGGGTAGDQASDEPQAPVNPSTVTVSVLNGTTVPGLAAQIGDEVESAGFQRGNVANALDQQRAGSTVLYAEGADREAKLVAKRLGIATLEPIDPDSAALGGNASVVVIVGADQTQ
jgi:hypothetical protein